MGRMLAMPCAYAVALILGTVLLTCSASFPAALSDQPVLELEIGTGTDTYLLGEPVDIYFRLTNRGTDAVLGDFGLTFTGDRLYVWIASEGRAPVRYMPLRIVAAQHATIGARGWKLLPGESVIAGEALLYNTAVRELAFPTPGRYSITASCRYDARRSDCLTSKPVSVLITAPTGVDACAYEIMAGNEEAQFLQHELNGEPREAAADQMGEVMRRFPDSRYALLAQAALNWVRTKDPGFRLAADRALAPVQQAILEDGSAILRNRRAPVYRQLGAVYRLSLVAHQAAVASLMATCVDRQADVEVRIRAALALGTIADESAAAGLVKVAGLRGRPGEIAARLLKDRSAGHGGDAPTHLPRPICAPYQGIGSGLMSGIISKEPQHPGASPGT